VADPRVDRVAEELDAGGLEPLPRLADVGHAKREAGGGRLELLAVQLGVPEAQRDVAGLDLPIVVLLGRSPSTSV